MTYIFKRTGAAAEDPTVIVWAESEGEAWHRLGGEVGERVFGYRLAGYVR